MIPYISMMLTDQCNSLCKYCYVNAETAPKEPLPVSEVQGFLRSYAEQDGKVVLFTGGEVLLYPGIEEVVEYAKSLDLKVHLFTNGLLLDQNRLDRIKDFVDGFAVSLDGPEEIHDARRGVSGAYRKTLEAMQRLKDAKKSFSVQMTISKSNLDAMDHVAQVVREYQVGVVKFADMIKVGRGKDYPDEYLSEDDLLTIKRKAAELSERYQYQTIFQTNLSTRAELDTYYLRGNLSPVHWVDSRGNIFAYIVNDLFRIGQIAAFQAVDTEKEAQLGRLIAENVFPRLRERRIADIYEEVESWAEGISSVNL